jgi:hypothetical protein
VFTDVFLIVTQVCLIIIPCALFLLPTRAAVKASYVMSLYYEARKNAQACSFGGNGTVNPNSVSAANAAASSCISNPGSVFTPSPAPSTTGKTQSSGTSKPKSAGVSLEGPLLGLTITAVVTLLGGLWTLA